MKALAVALCVAVLPATVLAQRAEEVYKNIRSLRGVPAARVPGIMETFNRVLGVACTHCHVDQEWHREDKAQFGTTRKMLAMVDGISSGKLREQGGVTCWSCHRGQAQPSRLPATHFPRINDELARWPAEARDFPDGVKLTMVVAGISLGVACDHCHTGTDWKNDSKKPMATGRVMFSMFQEFPKYIPEEAGRMQCWTCHKGSTKVGKNPAAR